MERNECITVSDTKTFYAGKIIQNPELANPTLVILTDRNDLDEQLFTTFADCSDLLRQNPVQGVNIAKLSPGAI